MVTAITYMANTNYLPKLPACGLSAAFSFEYNVIPML